MQNILIWFLISFAIALVLSPLILLVLKRLKAGQTILHYVEAHKTKSGTPTMGGFIFILPMLFASAFILSGRTPLANIIILASIGYALIGFLDDFIKIRGQKNQGLRAYQKIIGQGGIALLVSWFYYMANPTGRIFIPFFNEFIEFGFWIAPLCFIALIATTNSVNLTDGLDGLAGSVSSVYLLIIGIIMALIMRSTLAAEFAEQQVFLQIIAITLGGLLCFLVFNTNKASVFMGDTGSLYLGSIIALTSFFSFLGLYIIILGCMFVLSSITDIIQVAYFKTTKKSTGEGKRIFRMAPFHHHLEMGGLKEARIVCIYSAVTLLIGIICIVTLL